MQWQITKCNELDTKASRNATLHYILYRTTTPWSRSRTPSVRLFWKVGMTTSPGLCSLEIGMMMPTLETSPWRYQISRRRRKPWIERWKKKRMPWKSEVCFVCIVPLSVFIRIYDILTLTLINKIIRQECMVISRPASVGLKLEKR